jgi:hypothetical protein
MAKRQYQRRESGLLIPGSDHVELPQRRVFDSRRWMGRRRCCCEGGGGPTYVCDYCSTGTDADEYQVDISGIVDETCNECGSLNGSYVLQRCSDCYWRYNFETILCDGTYGCDAIELFMEQTSVPGYGNVIVNIGKRVVSSISDPCGVVFYGITWGKVLSPTQDCAFAAGLDIPFVSEATGFFCNQDLCDPTASTCTVTGL